VPSRGTSKKNSTIGISTIPEEDDEDSDEDSDKNPDKEFSFPDKPENSRQDGAEPVQVTVEVEERKLHVPNLDNLTSSIIKMQNYIILTAIHRNEL